MTNPYVGPCDGLPHRAYKAPQVEQNRFVGIGGAPTRPCSMPTSAAERKLRPVASGFLDYFPDAVIAVSELSMRGNEQHNPGQPLHWARGKSTDEADTLIRHLMERGKFDTDGVRHSVKAAWRVMALAQKEIEEAVKNGEPVTLSEDDIRSGRWKNITSS